jgi:fatty acid desaturase
MSPSTGAALAANSGHTSGPTPTEGLLPLRAPVPVELLTRATLPGLYRLAAAQWAWLGLCWAGLVLVPEAAPVLALLVAGRLHALGVILHDAIHLPWRHKGPGPRMLELFCGLPVATTLEAMRYHHLRHHRDAGLPSDPYRRPPASPWRQLAVWLRVCPILLFWVLRGPFGLLAWLLPPLRTPYARLFLQDRSDKALTHDAEVLACARAESGQVLFHLAVLGAALRWPSVVGLGYGLPFLLTSGLCAWRLLAEHTPRTVQGRTLRDVLACTSDHGLGWPGRLLTAPLNVGCHVVHHLHPQVSLHHLPRLRDWYLLRYPDLYPRPRRP